MQQVKIFSFLIAAATTSFMTFSASAEMQTMSNFNYDYLEARIGAGPLSYGVGMSKSIHPNAHIRAEVDTRFESDFDSTLAVGFHAPINDWADIYGELGLRNVKKDDFYFGESQFGVEINLGARQWISPQIEIDAEVGYLNIKDDDEFFGSVGGRFHATELFSFGAQARFNEFYGEQFMFTTRFIY